MSNRITEQPFCQTDVSGSTFVNADCFDVFPFIEDKSIDAIICDLPYGTTACKWDSVLPLDKLWKEYERIVKDDGAIIFDGHDKHPTVEGPKLHKRNGYYYVFAPAGGVGQGARRVRHRGDEEGVRRCEAQTIYVLQLLLGCDTASPQKAAGGDSSGDLRLCAERNGAVQQSLPRRQFRV